MLFPPQPIPTTRLRQICNDACDSAIAGAGVYEHAHTQGWNNAIINNVLKALISESTPAGAPAAVPQYKFVVNTTIVQHLSDPRPTGTSTAGTQTTGGAGSESVSLGGGADATNKKVGRRGMHSASGAYWNNEKDGMWSHKYEGGEGKGMDIVISVMWIAV